VTDTRVWNEWNRDAAPEYPHEKAVQFILRRFPVGKRSGCVVLDLGCGTGRHCLFLAREGFSVVGRDISRVAVDATRARLSVAGFAADLAVAGLVDPLVSASSVDAVICIGVVDSAGPGAAAPAFAAALQALRPGGAAFFVFASDVDFRVHGPNPLGLHGYSDAEVAAAASASAEGKLSAGFWMDRYITTYQNGALEQNDHLVTLFRVD
jgi:SAM-dependent methyltransferase